MPQAAVSVTGTTTITSFGSSALTGQIKFVTFSAALTLTYNATSLILPSAANITTAAGDSLIAEALGSGNWRVIGYLPATGLAPVDSYQVVKLAADTGTISSSTSIINLTQGTAGIWKVTAYATFEDTAGASAVSCELTDGTTIFSSGVVETGASNLGQMIFLTGVIANPAGNIALKCAATGTATIIKANMSGAGHDTQIVGERIQ